VAGQAGKSKRSSERKKETRKRCWASGEQRKLARIQAQRQRETANRARRKAGEPLPWELACAQRAARREGMYAIWAKEHTELAAEQARKG
jgi:hypothetical protein